MHKLAAAALAVPTLAAVYAVALARRTPRVSVGLVIALAMGVGLGLLGAAPPQSTSATPPSQAVPLTSAMIRTSLQAGHAPNAPVELHFSTAMNPRSVAAHLAIEPPAPITLRWAADHRTLEVLPVEGWRPGRLYTITVQPGALADTGRPLSISVRAAFFTRAATGVRLRASAPVGDRVLPTTAFDLEFDLPPDPATLAGAVTTDPPIDGLIVPSADGSALRWTFLPDAPLEPDRTYRVRLRDGVRDVQGALVAGPIELEVRTVPRPGVVRFRPRDGQADVARGATLSARFSEAMDRQSTRGAFDVVADGTPVEGRISFAEGDTVLVFAPAVPFAFGQTVVVTVSTEARSAAGVPLASAIVGSFTTEPKPAVKATPKPSGGGTVGSGTWAAVESYYLGLMNCTRTGGLVSKTGECTSPGGRNVAPLTLERGISDRVSRPYAKLLATRNVCSHYADGSPGDRLKRAGYTSHAWAENLGCRSGDPYAAVLGSHLYFQGERNWSPQGGHYVNMMNAKYDRAGIGVWVASGRVRLVVSFYHP